MLETPRLRLRHFSETDLEPVFAGLSDPRVVAYYGLSHRTLDECREQMAWYKAIEVARTGLWLALETRSTGCFAGAIGMYGLDPEHQCAEFGYWLLPEFWGKGMMHEAARAFLPHVYASLPLHRLLAQVEPPNHRSTRLLKRLGFQYEGLSRECERKDSHFISLENYSLLRSDPAARAGLCPSTLQL